MLDRDLTEEYVTEVLAFIGLDDPGAGQLATDTWMSLTAGEGPAMLSLAGLQNWLWWLLPKRSHSDDYDYWVDSAAAAAVLFDRLGEARYAEVCRSETTAIVFEAWRQSRDKGLAETKKALAASPVNPPDIEDFAWGSIFGVWEGEAQNAVERELEHALDDGRLDPSARTWRRTAAGICLEVLDTAQLSQAGQSWRSLVYSERAAGWATDHRLPANVNGAREQAAAKFASPPPEPAIEVMRGSLEPLTWLANACADGVTLTASGYLPRALVLEITEHFDWWIWEKPPHSEADVHQLLRVHEAARKLGILRKQGRKLTTTKAGRRMDENLAAWWPRLVLLGKGAAAYSDAVIEHVALALIDVETIEVDQLQERVAPLLVNQGWSSPDGPVTETEHGHSIYRLFQPWQIWGFIDVESARWGPTPEGNRQISPSTVTVTSAGRAACALWLHSQITSPRTQL
ncbi:MAG: hypothetical protein ACC652_01255 [Acidimicrobiales bacterium]